MKIKLVALFLSVLAFAGCSLAQPERQDAAQTSDRFVGVYVMFGARNLDRTNWVEYGSDAIDTEFGAFDIPREVLFAEYDEETHAWAFPGLNGYCVFSTVRNDLSTGVDAAVQQVAIAFENKVCTRLEGTIYIEKSDEDYFTTHYNVYETLDGRIYIDGSGNSSTGPASSGGSMSSSYENTYRENGEIVETYEFTVKVAMEPVVPTCGLTLVQYDANDVEVCRDALALEEQHITLHEDTAWMVVVETDKEGTCHRAAYEPPTDEEDVVAHSFYLPQADGSIQVRTLVFEAIA